MSFIVVLTAEESLRVRKFIARVGSGVARKVLGVSETTLDAARSEGRMQRPTRDRLMATMTIEEARQ